MIFSSPGLSRHIEDLLTVHGRDALSDAQLLLRYRSERDDAAFAVLVRRHGPLVLGVCRRILGDRHAAEDAFQAVFLVLARKAAAIRKPDAVGCWLHGVAARVARKALAAARRRDARRPPVPDRVGADPEADVTLRELRGVIDEELNQLPDKYRAPLILCYLEGQTRDEAAQKLGWPPDTLKTRIDRARKLLGERLRRRGIALSSALIPLVAVTEAPAALLESTTRAALCFGTGQATSPLSISAISLAQGAMHAMSFQKIKLFAATLTALVLLGTGGGFVLNATQQAAPLPVAADDPKAEPAKERARPTPAAVAFLEPDWQLSSLPEDKKEQQQWIEAVITKALDRIAKEGQPALSAFVPVMARNRVLMRTYQGIHVVDLNENKESQLRQSWSYGDGGSFGVLHDPNKRGVLQAWYAEYEQRGPHGLLFDNALSGGVSSDDTSLFFVDDLLLPPPPRLAQLIKDPLLAQPGVFGALGAHVAGNRLKGYNLESMKLIWDLGGKGYDLDPKIDLLQGSFFLGAPLALNGKLYVLNDKAREIRLLCLTAKDKNERLPPPPDLNWQLDLVKATEAFDLSLARRTRAAQPVAAGDLLLCPTNAGALVAVDIAKEKVAWKYQYRNAAPIADLSLKSSPPVVVGDKVVFAAPDDGSFHCVRLSTGEMIWKVQRAEDVYLAGVFGERVLLVGRRGCRGLGLADGKEVWRTPAGIPSGRGLAVNDGCYLLPLQTGARTRAPELCGIDPSNGAIVGHILAKPGDVPGNLARHGDILLSQSPLGVTAYQGVKLDKLARTEAPAPRSFEDLYTDLGAAGVPSRNSAKLALWMTGDEAAKFLGQKLRPVKVDRQAILQSIEDLASDNAAVRMKATKALEEAGELAELPVRDALAKKPALDLTRRLEALAAHTRQLRSDPPPELRRQIQAVITLEMISSPAARKILEQAAQGDGEAILTEQAEAAVKRLSKGKETP